MFIIRALEKKEVIRFFGISLILAPFVNNIAKVYLLVNIQNKWSWMVFWQVFNNSNFSSQLLSGASIIIGILMLNGSIKAWRYALLLLGIHIIMQLMSFSTVVKTSKISILFFLINVLVFLFIADQLVWKVQAKPKKRLIDLKPDEQARVQLNVESNVAPVQKPSQFQAQVIPMPAAPRLVQKATSKILIEFEGYGKWGELSQITNKGIQVKSITRLPVDFEGKSVEMTLKDGTAIRATFSHQKDDDFHFNFADLTKDQIKNLNGWLKSIS